MQSIKAIINHIAAAQNNTSVATIPRHLPEKQHSTSSTNDHLLHKVSLLLTMLTMKLILRRHHTIYLKHRINSKLM